MNDPSLIIIELKPASPLVTYLFPSIFSLILIWKAAFSILRGGTALNCEELFQMIKMLAQTVDDCRTKNELMRIAEEMQRGMSGARTMLCLKQLRMEGRVKTAKKCVQWGKCYYDPPQETLILIRDRARALDRKFQELKEAQLENLKNDFEKMLKLLEEANSSN